MTMSRSRDNAAGFGVEVERVDGLVVVSVSGDIDLDTVPVMQRALDKIDPRERAVVEMSEVTFMDSTGLSVAIRQSMRMRGFGVRCTFVNRLRPYGACSSSAVSNT